MVTAGNLNQNGIKCYGQTIHSHDNFFAESLCILGPADVEATLLTAGIYKVLHEFSLSELFVYQRGLAPGILVPRFSCTDVCCRAPANQRPGSSSDQC